MPCLNEAETLAICIRKAKKYIADNNLKAEVLIADNGSTDRSVEIALAEDARVIPVSVKGYGAALLAGIKESKGKYIIMGDADDSYDFYALNLFVDKLKEGFELVMGNRFKGGIRPGAMPFMHQYFGNPVLTFIGRLFFRNQIGDYNCGLRGFNKDKILSLHLVTPGMEFATEMVVKSTIRKLTITEVPIILYPDGRKRPPHLQTWRDGWRQLVFLLIYSPKWLFLFPSLFFLFLSFAGIFALLPGTLYFSNFALDIHTLTIVGTTTALSYQLLLFTVLIRVFSINMGLYPAQKKHRRFTDYFTLERGIVIGLIMLISGLFMLIVLFYKWAQLYFGPIPDLGASFRLLIPAVTLISLGVQTIFSSFFLRILNLKPQNNTSNEMV